MRRLCQFQCDLFVHETHEWNPVISRQGEVLLAEMQAFDPTTFLHSRLGYFYETIKVMNE